MNAFRKSKKPKRLLISDNCYIDVDREGCAHLRIGYPSVGPRTAIKIARWLERYAKWSSLK